MDDRDKWLENMAARAGEHYDLDADEARAFVREFAELIETSSPTEDMFELIYQQEADRLEVPGKPLLRSDVLVACVERIVELTKLAMRVSLEGREDEEEE